MKKQTLALHHGYNKDEQRTMAVPIYQSTAYEFPSTEYAAETFSLQHGFDNVYTRIGNPTTAIFEQRFAALEGGSAALATSSGMAAIFYAAINLAEMGDNIVASKKLYGGTVTLFTSTLKRFGIEARFFDPANPEGIKNLVDDKTKMIFFESITNPSIDVPDFGAIAEIANESGVVSVVDNTVPSPILCRPLEHGCDVTVHSASKYTTGQGLAIGGIIVERENLSEKLAGNPRYPQFNEPDPSYHGLVYVKDVAPLAFVFRARMSLMRDTGAAPAPFNSWLYIQGIETLPLRMKQHSGNALAIAEFLAGNNKVRQVNYPGLKDNPNFGLAQKYMPDGCSGLLSFDVGDYESAKSIVDNTKLFSLVTNIGDSKSIITHPASTTHQQLSEEELIAAGVPQGLIRISAGLEDPEDLVNDLEQAILV